MSFLAAAGKTGSVMIGTVSYAYKEWSLSMEEKMIETSNFSTGSYRAYIGGLIGATLDLTGPYDTGPAGSGGNNPLVVGTTYTFILNVNSLISYTVSAIVSKIGLTQNIDDCAQLKVSAQVTGSFVSQLS